MISLTAVVVLAILAGVLVVTHRSAQKPAVAANNDDPTNKRPDYPGDGEGNSSVADSAPLKEKKNPQPVIYNGAPVIQACNLLTLADLEKLGMRYESNPLTSMEYERSTITDSGTAPLEVEKGVTSFLPVVGVNGCTHPIKAGGGKRDRIMIEAFQPKYTNLDNLPHILRYEKYQQQAGIGGVEVYSKPSTPSEVLPFDYVLRRGDTVVRIGKAVNLENGANRVDQLVKTVAANLEVQVAHPEGPSTLTYDSSAFPKSFAHPGTLLDPEMFAKVWGTAPAPAVLDEPAPSVGRIMFNTVGDTRSRNYIQVRRTLSTGDKLARAKKLTLRVTSYLTEDSAKIDMKSKREFAKGQNLATTIGDDSFMVTEQGNMVPYKAGTLLFSKGRFAFELYADQDSKLMQPAQATPVLSAVAGQIVQKVNNQG